MPYWVTIARATAVAFSMSLDAPVVGSWKTSSSAAAAAEHVGELVEHLAAGRGVLVLVRAAPSCSRGPGRAAGS